MKVKGAFVHAKTGTVVALLTGAGALLCLAGYCAVQAASSQVEHYYVAFDVSPDGKQVVFSSAEADLYLFDLKTRQVRPLTKNAGFQTTPAFSPDGKSILYAASVKQGGGAGLFVRSLDGKQVHPLTPGLSTYDIYPSYAPDGKRITFVRAHRHRPYSMGGWTWDNYDVYVMNRDGSNLHRVTRNNYYQASSPRFLNDGKTLVFSADGDYPGTRTYLFTVPTDGSQSPKKRTMPPGPLSSAERPGEYAVWGGEPHVAPDGKRVVFLSDRAKPFDYDLWVMDVNGESPHALKVTRFSHYNQGPVFLPDSKRILFLAGMESNAGSRPIFSLWEVGADGTHAHRIADSSLFTSPLRWKPKPSP